jgi:hypothetical protein
MRPQKKLQALCLLRRTMFGVVQEAVGEEVGVVVAVAEVPRKNQTP